MPSQKRVAAWWHWAGVRGEPYSVRGLVQKVRGGTISGVRISSSGRAPMGFLPREALGVLKVEGRGVPLASLGFFPIDVTPYKVRSCGGVCL